MTEWRPIGSLPAHTEAILYAPQDGVFISYRYDKLNYWHGEEHRSCGGSPTHWMPLPERPTKDE